MTTIDTHQCIRAILDEYYEESHFNQNDIDDDSLKVEEDNSRNDVFNSSSIWKDLHDQALDIVSDCTNNNDKDFKAKKETYTYCHAVSPASNNSEYHKDHDPINEDTKVNKEHEGKSTTLSSTTTKQSNETQSQNINQILSTSNSFTRDTGSSDRRSTDNEKNAFPPFQQHPEFSQDNENGDVLQDEQCHRFASSSSLSSSICKTATPSDKSGCKKEKRPFLKKGSRKEPSSLQRINEKVLKNGMRFTNETQVEGSIVRDNNKNNNSKNLEHLERMQKEQIENLEKRLERREKARLVIRQNKSKSKHDSKGNKNERTDIASEKSVVCDETCNEKEEESPSSDSSTSYSPTSNDESSEESSVAKKNLDAKRTFRDPNSIYKTKGTSNKKKAITSSSVDRGRRTNYKSPEIDEQWQVIKSMRKRQEAALRTAEKEREEVRSWAANERNNLQKWADQQRTLIKKERKKVMNEMLASQRKRRKDSLEDAAAQESVSSHKQLRAEIETLKNSLQKLQIENDTAKSKSRLHEKRLRDIIAEREKSIESMKMEVEKLNIQYHEAKKERDDLKQFKNRIESKKKKKKKKDPTSEQLEHMEGQNEPVSSNNSENISTSEITQRCDDEECAVDMQGTHEEGQSNDDEAIRILTSRSDLVNKPTKEWLQKHLKVDQVQDIGTSITGVAEHCIKTKMIYDPKKYAPKLHVQEVIPSQQSTNCSKQSEYQPESISPDINTTIYRNGTQKEILPDGTMIVRFTNGDIKTTYSHIGIVVYYYAESGTSHTTHPDGLQVYEFASGQTEYHYQNGRKEVCFPDGTQQVYLPNGHTVQSFPDGVNVMQSNTGRKVVQQSFN